MTWEQIANFAQSAISIFALVNPLGNLPTFVGMTEDATAQERRKLFHVASFVALVVICSMALIGQVLLRHVFHIRMHEFAFAGGLLLVVVGIRRIVASERPARVALPQADDERRATQLNLAVSPIAIPFLVGPGSIVNVMVVADQNGRVFALLACMVAFLAVALILHYSGVVYRIMGRTGSLAVGRVMQIFIVAVGVKLCFRALVECFPVLAE